MGRQNRTNLETYVKRALPQIISAHCGLHQKQILNFQLTQNQSKRVSCRNHWYRKNRCN